jgi:predicted Na+-dependent transporter
MLNTFARNYFNTILFTATIAGFLIPKPGEYSGPLILGLLAFIIFSSCFKVNFSLAFFREHSRWIIGFYLLRFIILPVVLFKVLEPIDPYFAVALALLSLMPAGVTSPAFSNVFGGNTGLSLALLILSSSLAPFVIPYLGGYVLSTQLDIDQNQLLLTLVISVLLPYFLHLPFRRVGTVKKFMYGHDAFISIVGIAVIFSLAIAEYRSVLQTDWSRLAGYFLVSIAGFALLYLLGWGIAFRESVYHRVALLFSSGANNVALGIVVSFLYFPENVGIFFVVSEIVWVLILIPVKKIMTTIRLSSSN